MLSHKYFDKFQFKFNWLYACVFCFCFCFCRSRSTRILSISALKTDDYESMKCIFKWFHKYTAVHSYNYAKVVRYENELVKKKKCKKMSTISDVIMFWRNRKHWNLSRLHHFVQQSVCFDCDIHTQQTLTASAHMIIMLIRSLINFDGYQCLCTFGYVAAIVFVC